MLCVVSVVDSISVTSMPINEFVLYRSKHFPEIKQVLLVLDVPNDSGVILPNTVRVFFVGKNRKAMRQVVRQIEQEAKEKRDKTVYHLHHQKSAIAFFAATVGLHIRGKTLYTVHSSYRSRDWKYRLSSCFCVLRSKYANCVSQSAYEEYSKAVKMWKGRRFFAIENGVDTDRIAAAADESIRREPNTMIYVGRMIGIKNHAFLIELMRRLPEWKLILAGAEDATGAIRAKISEYGLEDRVRILGLIPREEVFRQLQSAVLYVSPSLVEGMPVSVLEAMDSGLVPILSDIKPHREIARSCRSVTVLPLEEERWIEAIREWENRGVPEERLLALREDVRTNFSLDAMHKKYFELYEKL